MLRVVAYICWYAVIFCLLTLGVLSVVFDFNSLKPQIEAQTSTLLDEKVRIKGEIGLGTVGFHPALVMHGVEIGTDIKADTVALALQDRKPLLKLLVRADNLKLKDYPLGNYDIPVTVHPSGFEIYPLRGERDGSVLTGKVKYLGKELHIDGVLKDFPLGKIADEAEGKVEGNVQLDGKGDDQAQLVHTLKGRLMLTSGAGKLTSKSLNFWSRGLLSSLLPGNKDATTLNCAIVDLDIAGGLASSRAIVVDTGENTVFAKGSVDLDNWHVNMVLKPNPKDMSLVSFATPVHVTGPLDNATVTPEAGGVAKKIGGMLLGVVNPAFALIPLMETGFGDYKGSCADILKKNQPKNPL